LRTRIAQRQQSEGSQAEWYREGEYDGTYYRFDLTGNLVERKGPMSDTRFIWDANQRLVESNKDSKATTYHYDPLARRISKETDGVVTRFFWDGDALAGDVVTGETLEPATSQLREWVYYPETFEPLVMVQNHGTSASEMYLYHNDPNGCPTRLLDTQGEVVWGARYSAWGGVEQLVVDRVDNPIRLQGQYYDKEFVLHYNRFRYFDTLIASFISLDPLGLKPGENPYSFAPNHWLWYDPLGLMCAARRRSLWQRIKDFFTGRRATKPISEVDEAAEDFMRRHFSPEEIEEAGRVRTVPGPRGTTRGGNRPRGRRTPGAENFDPDSLYRRKRKW
jgi:RHS repeat-associated protein